MKSADHTFYSLNLDPKWRKKLVCTTVACFDFDGSKCAPFKNTCADKPPNDASISGISRKMEYLSSKWGLLLIVILWVGMCSLTSSPEPGPACKPSGGRESTFLYFAYGSNLLTKRIHFQNPSATFRDAAKLDGYKLEFRLPSEVNVPTLGIMS